MNAQKQFIGDLTTIVGAAGIVTETADLAPLEVDWRGMFRGKALCAVRPRSSEQVSRIVGLCRARGVAIVPQGGNTGLAGGSVPDDTGHQLLLSLSRLNRIRAVDPVGMTLTAEAGCILAHAQNAATDVNRLLPVSLASEGSATVGGIVASNAGGVNVLRYGMTRNLVTGLEVVLPDGRIADGLRCLRKDNAGFDWKQIFIGSEGTLGIITAAVLRLVPRPAHKVTALIAVASPQAALELLGRCYDAVGDQISAFELMSAASVRLIEQHRGQHCPISGNDWFVLTDIASSLPGVGDAIETMFADVLERGMVQDGTIATSGNQADELWALRENITDVEARAGRSVKHDVSVPLPAIAAFIDEAQRAVDTHLPGARVNAFGHVGDGNIHFNVIVTPTQEPATVNRIIHDIVASYGGSISAEHGIGQYRVNEVARYRSATELDLGASLKRAIDPSNLLNPGKVIRIETHAR